MRRQTSDLMAELIELNVFGGFFAKGGRMELQNFYIALPLH